MRLTNYTGGIRADYGARFVQNINGKLGFNFRVDVRL